MANAVQANLLAAPRSQEVAVNLVYNVAVGDQTTLNGLHTRLVRALQAALTGMQAAKFNPGRKPKPDIGPTPSRRPNCANHP